ncbi:MAG: ferrous iron transport protein A [Oscillospiraceae bacterium]|nr:ferrous iron transport protein A [Oscillospiraceae bacterium]
MTSETALFYLKDGFSGRVTRLETQGSMRRRLQDIGIIKGTRIKCLMHSPSGDPAAYLIKGAVIALRSEDSRQIFIRPEK